VSIFLEKKAQFLLGLKAERKSLHYPINLAGLWKLRPKSGSGWAANYF
jgi:hypothetical protein